MKIEKSVGWFLVGISIVSMIVLVLIVIFKASPAKPIFDAWRVCECVDGTYEVQGYDYHYGWMFILGGMSRDEAIWMVKSGIVRRTGNSSPMVRVVGVEVVGKGWQAGKWKP